LIMTWLVRSRKSRRGAVVTSLLSLLLARPTPAQAQGADNPAALALFEDGKRLTSEGDYAQGCPKLLASFNLVPKLGTLLNLADCYERSGRTASAWARFTEAAALADRSGQQERADFARTHAAALAPRLSRIVITLTSPVAEGLVVQRDGTAVDAAAFGTAVPVDPGPHTIEARAPHRQPWTSSVVVELDAGQRTVAIPVLALAGEPGAVAVPAPFPVTEPPPEPATPPSRSPQRTWAIVAGSVGLGGLAASLVIGALASRRYDQSNTDGGCVNDRCTSRGLDERSSASSIAGVATGLAVGGAVLLGAGAVLYLTAPSTRPSISLAHTSISLARTSISLGPTSIALGRSW